MLSPTCWSSYPTANANAAAVTAAARPSRAAVRLYVLSIGYPLSGVRFPTWTQRSQIHLTPHAVYSPDVAPLSILRDSSSSAVGAHLRWMLSLLAALRHGDGGEL
jgi:hypothetical protein